MKRSGFRKQGIEEIQQKRALKQLKDKDKPLSPFHTKKRSTGQIGGNKRLPRAKKQSISTLKKKLWTIVAKRIKERDKNICFTSGKYVEGANAHCGHGTPNSVSGGRLRYHPKNLHCQSYNENINLGGNGREYYKRQVEKYGQEAIDKLDALKQKYIKVDTIYYQKLIDLYSNGSWEEIEYFLENE